VILWQAYLEEVQAVSENTGLSRHQAAFLVTEPDCERGGGAAETPRGPRREDRNLTRVDEGHRQGLVEWIGRGDNNATWPKPTPKKAPPPRPDTPPHQFEGDEGVDLDEWRVW